MEFLLIPLFFKFQMSGLGQSPMALLSHDSNTGGGSNHSSAGTGVEPSPEKPVTTPRTPTERKRKRKTNASGPSLQGKYSCLPTYYRRRGGEFVDAKGQQISKTKYHVLPSSKKPTRLCTFFCPSL